MPQKAGLWMFVGLLMGLAGPMGAQIRDPLLPEPMDSIESKGGLMLYQDRVISVFDLGSIVQPVPEAKSRHQQGETLWWVGLGGLVLGGGYNAYTLLTTDQKEWNPMSISLTLGIPLLLNLAGSLTMGSSMGLYNEHVARFNASLSPNP